MDKITIERETLRSTLDVLTEMPPSPGKALVVSALRAALAALAAQPADIVNPISQQEPVAYRHSKTGQLYDSEEEVPLADGDEIERLRKRVDELSDLLTSARAIAERFGNNTHWERFSARLGAAGIGSITPRTFRVLPSDTPTPPKDE